MANCDLCGEDCSSSDLLELLAVYQIPGVADLCPSCVKWANDRKHQLTAQIAPTLRAEIEARRANPVPKLGLLAAVWWRLLK